MSWADFATTRRLDQLHQEFPSAGSRTFQGLPVAQGGQIARRLVIVLIWTMGTEALYHRPCPTKPEPRHKIYPYLPRSLVITRPNQAWAMDVTHIPMARGFVYLAVVLDWAALFEPILPTQAERIAIHDRRLAQKKELAATYGKLSLGDSHSPSQRCWFSRPGTQHRPPTSHS